MSDEPSVLDIPMTAAYFRLILRRFGVRREHLLAGTGVGDDDVEITVRAQLRQLENLQRVAPPDWGLQIGAALDGVAHGPSGAMIVTAATLDDAVDSLVRYASVRAPFIELRGTLDDRRYRVQILETCPLGTVRLPILDMVMMSTQSVIESALGRRMDGASFQMPGPRPSYWRRYGELLHGPVVFEGNVATLSIPAEWLRLPCPLSDPVVHRGAAARLEAMSERLAGDFIDTRIARLLDHDGGPSLQQMARRLGISPRTLVRRLAQRRTSYRALLDGHRRRRAIELLTEHRITIAEIAERLGYEAPTNFGRACRRWFGMSPSDYRRERVQA